MINASTLLESIKMAATQVEEAGLEAGQPLAVQLETVQPEAVTPEVVSATEPPRTERINGQEIRVGTLEEFVKAIFGIELAKLPRLTASNKYAGITLGIEKFKTSQGKFYRLIWIFEPGKKAWLAAEDDMDYCCKGNADIAGYDLADELRVIFDDKTR